MIIITVKKHEKLPVYRVTTDIKGEVLESNRVDYMLGKRDKVVTRLSDLIAKIKGDKDVKLLTEVDTLFRCDILFTLRNRHLIDLQKGR